MIYYLLYKTPNKNCLSVCLVMMEILRDRQSYERGLALNWNFETSERVQTKTIFCGGGGGGGEVMDMAYF